MKPISNETLAALSNQGPTLDIDNGQGVLLDSVDAAQQGLYDGLAGAAEFVGADSVRDWAKEGSDSQTRQMSHAGREAMQKTVFRQGEDGGIGFGEAITDPRAVAMQVAHMIGMNVDILGGGAMVKGGRVGFTAVRNTVKKKLGKKVADENIIEEAVKRANETALQKMAGKFKDKTGVDAGSVFDMGVASHAVSGGLGAMQARDEVLDMEFEELIQSEPFKESARRLKASNPEAAPTEILTAARQEIAERAASQVKMDPALLTSNMLLGGFSNALLEKVLKGRGGAPVSIGTEIVSEGMQGATEQIAGNRAIRNFADPEQSITEGALTAGLNEAALGGISTGAMAAGRKGYDHYMGRNNNADNTQPDNEVTPPQADETPPPVNETQPPVNETQPPVNETQPPVNETQPPEQAASVEVDEETGEIKNVQPDMLSKEQTTNRLVQNIDNAVKQRQAAGEFIYPPGVEKARQLAQQGADETQVNAALTEAFTDPARQHMEKTQAQHQAQRADKEKHQRWLQAQQKAEQEEQTQAAQAAADAQQQQQQGLSDAYNSNGRRQDNPAPFSGSVEHLNESRQNIRPMSAQEIAGRVKNKKERLRDTVSQREFDNQQARRQAAEEREDQAQQAAAESEAQAQREANWDTYQQSQQPAPPQEKMHPGVLEAPQGLSPQRRQEYDQAQKQKAFYDRLLPISERINTLDGDAYFPRRRKEIRKANGDSLRKFTGRKSVNDIAKEVKRKRKKFKKQLAIQNQLHPHTQKKLDAVLLTYTKPIKEAPNYQPNLAFAEAIANTKTLQKAVEKAPDPQRESQLLNETLIAYADAAEAEMNTQTGQSVLSETDQDNTRLETSDIVTPPNTTDIQNEQSSPQPESSNSRSRSPDNSGAGETQPGTAGRTEDPQVGNEQSDNADSAGQTTMPGPGATAELTSPDRPADNADAGNINVSTANDDAAATNRSVSNNSAGPALRIEENTAKSFIIKGDNLEQHKERINQLPGTRTWRKDGVVLSNKRRADAQALVDSINQEQENESGSLEETDNERVPGDTEQPGRDAQQPGTPGNTTNVAANQPPDVRPTENAGDAGRTGDSDAAPDVDGVRSTDSAGNGDDGRNEDSAGQSFDAGPRTTENDAVNKTAEPEPETKAEPEPETKAEPEPETKAEPEPETKAEPEPETKAEPEPETKAEPEPETKAEPEPETKAEPEPETKAEPEPETKAEPEPEPEPELTSPAAKQSQPDFVIDDPTSLVGGTPLQRFNKNKAAIEMRNTLIDEGRAPTKEEQQILAGYTGWGSFGQELFKGTWNRPAPKEGWEARDKWLREQLGEKEWQGLQGSIINAHYTDPYTIETVWKLVEKMGFKGGRVLEPAMGTGNFFGLMPPKLAGRSMRAGIELDPMTGSIAQMLYPNANIQIKGYEKSQTPDNFYDLVIGNWPFADFSPADRRYNKLSPVLHDYFFLKALDQVRPGGLVVGITSAGTMDKISSSTRAAMAKKGELIAAFRMPTGAFKEFAGTAVVTDLIIMRKREQPINTLQNENWIKSEKTRFPNGEISYNEYYHANPNHVLGEIGVGSNTTYRRAGLVVERPNNYKKRLENIIEMVPAEVYQADKTQDNISYVSNHTDDRQNALTKTPDGLFVVRGEYLAPADEVVKYAVKSEKTTAQREAELTGLVNLRATYAALLEAEQKGDSQSARKALRDAYEAHVKEYGSLNDSFGLKYLSRLKDPFYPSLAALEKVSKDGKVKPADIMSQSQVRGALTVDNPTTEDAFVLARAKNINPTMEEVATLAKQPVASVKKHLIEKGAVFELPNGDTEAADMYLSGDVRKKRREAKQALADGNKAMQRNLEALEKVVPEDIPHYQIEAQLGATWISASDYERYIADLLGMDDTQGIKITFQNGVWKAQLDSSLNHRVEATTGRFGSSKASFRRIVAAAFKNQTITVTYKDIDGKKHTDAEATAEVNSKIAEIRNNLGEWIWKDPQRRVRLEHEYNETRNAYAPPTFDGSFLPLQGMALSLGNGPFNLREHQLNAIWRGVVSRRGLYAHEVGTGKTFTMTGIAVESRRYGIAKKPIVFAHNANSKSVAEEAQMMYPAAKILYIDNLSAKDIETRMAQIANDDWDLIVMPHSLIDRLGFEHETLMGLAQEQLDALEEDAREAAQDEGADFDDSMLTDKEELKNLRSPTAKDLVKQRFKILASIEKLAQRASRENAIAFEKLGIDMVLVDEVHEFKKPPFSTKMKMKGLQTKTSDRSIALNFITGYVRANHNGNVHTFTGTPITNTLTELYHQMRYIMNEDMQDIGVSDWDGWFGSFAREVEDVELTSTGEYAPVVRLQAFINVPELRRLAGQYMDVVFADTMPEMQPRKVNGKTMDDPALTEDERDFLLNGRTERAQDRPYKRVINDSAQMDTQQQVVFEEVKTLAKSWAAMTGKQRQEAMAAGDPESPIIRDAMAEQASFDVRLVDAIGNVGKEGSKEMEPSPSSKPARVVRNLVEIYNGHKQANQVVFMGAGMAKSVKRSEGPPGDKKDVTYPAFSTMYDMIERLVQAGIPRNEIAVVDGKTSKAKRKAIADAMNKNEIRIVFGSTQSLGVGVNMQNNLRAMHHMDAPWMPGDLEQRNGRGHRQKNQWNTVQEYRYLTEKIDGRRWQVLAIKQRFINEFLRSEGDTRVIEGDAASDEQTDILSTLSDAAGDPRILIRAKLNKKLDKLYSRERVHGHAVSEAMSSRKHYEKALSEFEQQREKYIQEKAGDIADSILQTTKADNFSIRLLNKTLKSRKKATEFIDQHKSLRPTWDERKTKVGEFGGYPLFAHVTSSGYDFMMELGGLQVRSNGESIASLEHALRAFRDHKLPYLDMEIKETKDTLTSLGKVIKEPFHLAKDLKQVETELERLEKDIADNPEPPPQWLRDGAAIDTPITYQSKTYLVTGHRLLEGEYFVMASKGGAEPVQIPYLEVKDHQGMPIYEDKGTAAESPVDAKQIGDEYLDSSPHTEVDGKGMTKGQVQLILSGFLKDFKGLKLRDIKIVATPADHFGPETVEKYGAHRSRGAYNPKTRTLTLFHTNIHSPASLRRVLLHELHVHQGLGLYSIPVQEALLQEINKTRKSLNPTLKKVWKQVTTLYHFEDELTQAEEVLAKLAERNPAERPGWLKAMRKVAQIFWERWRKYRKTKGTLSLTEIDDTLIKIAEALAKGQRPGPRRPKGKKKNTGAPGSDTQATSNAAGFRGTDTGTSALMDISQDPAMDGTMFDIPADTEKASITALNRITDAIRSKWEAVKENGILHSLNNIKKDTRPTWLGTIPRRYLADMAGDMLPSLNNYLRRARSMDADRNEMMKMPAQLTDRWREFSAKNPKQAHLLAALMHEATKAGIDPSKVFEPIRDTVRFAPDNMMFQDELATNELITPEYVAKRIKVLKEQAKSRSGDGSKVFMERIAHLKNKLRQQQNREDAEPAIREAWEKLHPDAQQLFVDVRDAYTEQNQQYKKILEQRFFDQVEDQQKRAAYSTMLRQMFESMNTEGPYFPLARFGNYFGVIRDAEGSVIEFSRFEKASQKDKWLKERQLLLEKGDVIEHGTMTGTATDALKQINPDYHAQVMGILDNSNAGPSVMDEVNQLYLSMLPEMSMRKNFIHRKKTAGFNPDALRAFSHNMFHSAYQMARLKHSHLMESDLRAMDEEARAAKDTDKAGNIVSEMKLRHEWAMNPKASAWASKATSLGFTWYLGLSPATALVNVTQTPIVGLPVLGSRYGFLKATKALLKASADFVANGLHLDNALSGDELAAFKEFERRGLIEKTLAHDLAGVAEGGLEYSSTMHKIMEKISFMFHHAERYNREVTAMAAYRLAKEAGDSDALNTAEKLTLDAHFDYSNAERPRFMQNDTAKVILLFRQHSLNMTYRLLRDFNNAFRGESPEVKRQARRQLAGILGMTSLFAGVAGLPMYFIAGLITSMFAGDEDEPFDFNTEFRLFLAEHVGETAAQAIVHGPVDTFTKATVSSRVGLNNLWLREADPTLEGRAAVSYYVEQLLGPMFGIAFSAGTAASVMSEGQFLRGMEYAVPKSIKDGLRMYRYSTEGVNNLRGDALIQEVTALERIYQAIGFTPSRISEQYEQNSAIKTHERLLLNRKQLLLNQYALGKRMRDRDYQREVEESIRKFNRVNPKLKIDNKTKIRSLQTRKRYSQQATGAIVVDKRLEHLKKDLAFIDG